MSFTAHLRLRRSDSARPRTLYPPTSAIGHWQVEPEAGLISGSYIWFGQIKCGDKQYKNKLYCYKMLQYNYNESAIIIITVSVIG